MKLKYVLPAVFILIIGGLICLIIGGWFPAFGQGSNFSPPGPATSAAFATATTAGTCVQQATAVTGVTTSMVAVASPVSTPGVGATWSAFVSSAGNVTINECAVAASAGGTIAFNIRIIP